MTFESNPILERLPGHLRQYIKPQQYDQYTDIDQAVWRYVMRKNTDYLAKVAHPSYLPGLQKTGISINEIPNLYGMNRILKEIGWAAVAVDGFIPPAAFMEFQAYHVLVIASEIRQPEHIEYTPAPDIIHEGAGHAPIIANPEYAEYLRRFGEIGCKAIPGPDDHARYEAIRLLSVLKESPGVSLKDIQKAELDLAELEASAGAPSEMTLIRNLHWWTVEYGLIGTPENPSIYGAGLLSSIGESKWCLTNTVTKIPYSIEAAYTSFDITKPQPQLFVTPDFAYLSQVLEEFAATMGLRKGGLCGLKKLIASKVMGTLELSTGLQISGVFTNCIEHEDKPVYFQTTGPTALSYREKELIGHGCAAHPHGFGSPTGKLKGINLPIEDMSPRDLKAYNIYEGERIHLEFDGDLTVTGEVITGTRNLQGKIILITLRDCTVSHKGKILFSPDFGLYHMAIGAGIASAWHGPADLNSFKDYSNSQTENFEPAPSEKVKDNPLNRLYSTIRKFRLNREYQSQIAIEILQKLKENHKTDWLLAVELFELATVAEDQDTASLILEHLQHLKSERPEIAHLIDDGIALIPTSV
jgi:phenylalanine-4-hydroxylase